MSFSSQVKEKAAMLWHVQRVKGLVRERIVVGQLAMITVVEVECDDPGCPGPATQVAVMNPGGTRLSFTIHKPVHAVKASDIQAI